MKLIVFGATGGTGREVVKQALAQGYDVTAFVRNPAKMSITDDHLSLIKGDVMDLPAVMKAVQDQDAVVCSLGTHSLGKTSVRAAGTDHIIKGMQEHGVRRLIVVSAMGTGDSWSSLSSTAKMIYRTMLRHAKKDHEAQEKLVKASGLDWTIVRPSGLSDEAVAGSYDVGENIKAKTSRIPRADVAHFIIKELEESAYVGRAPTITN